MWCSKLLGVTNASTAMAAGVAFCMGLSSHILKSECQAGRKGKKKTAGRLPAVSLAHEDTQLSLPPLKP